MRYFSRITNDYFNELKMQHIEARQILKQFDRRIVTKEEMKDFIEDVESTVEQLNFDHSKEKQLEVVTTLTYSHDTAVIIPTYWKCILFKVKESD